MNAVLGQFNVDEESGRVTAVVSLDRERVGDFLQFHVLANIPDHHTASHALVLLTVVDVDDERPRFVSPRYSFSLPENVAVGSFTGVIVAVDRDSSPFADFRYKLNSSMFAINAHTGVIVTRAPLDRETTATHHLTVSVHSVYDSGSETGNNHVDSVDEATVVVKVDDVNDNAPYFRFPLPTNHTLWVPSTSGIGSTVGHVMAVDPDAGDNARLTYYMVSSERRNVFRLMADSGQLTVIGNLTALPRRLRFVVGVRDGGRPSRTATAVLTVHISVLSASSVGNTSSVGLSASHAGSLVMVDGNVMAAIAAIAGCFVVTLVFSLLAVTVHRRTATATRASTTRSAGSGTAASRAAWSKMATSDMSGIDSPLYSAVVNSATTTSVSSRTGNGKMSELCFEGPDIILTLESEPVNYAVSSGLYSCAMFEYVAFAMVDITDTVNPTSVKFIKLKCCCRLQGRIQDFTLGGVFSLLTSFTFTPFPIILPPPSSGRQPLPNPVRGLRIAVSFPAGLEEPD